jgi:hypothetical protein
MMRPRRQHHMDRGTVTRTLPVILTGDTTSTPDMRKVIDLECDLPPVENGNPRKLEAATHPPRYGGTPSRERAPNVHNGELTNAHRSGVQKGMRLEGIVNLTRSSRPSWPLSLERGQPYRRAKDFSAPDRRATHGRRIPPLLKLTMPMGRIHPTWTGCRPRSSAPGAAKSR